MKAYNVAIEKNGSVVTEFSIKANDLKEAKQTAQAHKRWEKYQGRVSVKLSK